ncbi:MAG TPA: AAA family ATPase [Micromonosporaceae bacterium]|jgi:RecA-family ATPase
MTEMLEQLRAELWDTDGLDLIPDPEPLIDDLIDLDSLVWVIGKPGSYKSFVALDWCACVATGETWNGRPVHKGPVLYVIAEGRAGIRKRVRAWEQATGHRMHGVAFLTMAVQVSNEVGWSALAALVAELAPVLVVIDTQARVTVGLEENSNTEMGTFVHRIDQLRRVRGSTVAVVHHTSAVGERGRGATAIDGAADTIAKVVDDGDGRITVSCEKNKNGAEWDDIRLRAVPMGDSIVLAGDDGAGRSTEPSRGALKTGHVWWGMHGQAWVGTSKLVDVVAPKPDLVDPVAGHDDRR